MTDVEVAHPVVADNQFKQKSSINATAVHGSPRSAAGPAWYPAVRESSKAEKKSSIPPRLFCHLASFKHPPPLEKGTIRVNTASALKGSGEDGARRSDVLLLCCCCRPSSWYVVGSFPQNDHSDLSLVLSSVASCVYSLFLKKKSGTFHKLCGSHEKKKIRTTESENSWGRAAVPWGSRL